MRFRMYFLVILCIYKKQLSGILFLFFLNWLYIYYKVFDVIHCKHAYRRNDLQAPKGDDVHRGTQPECVA